MKGRINIGRTTSNKRDDYISISVEDAVSGVQFFDGEMSLNDFAKCITGCGGIEIAFELCRPDLVGMKSEGKHELVKFTDKFNKDRKGLNSHDRSPSVDAVLAPFEVDGWSASVSDLFNHHHREGEYQRVLFNRHVNAETGKPILK